METAFAPGLQAGNRDCATAVRVLIIALRRVGQRGLQASKLRCIAEPSGNRSVRPGQIRIGFGEPRNETVGPDEKSDLRRQGTAGPRAAQLWGDPSLRLSIQTALRPGLVQVRISTFPVSTS